MTVLMGGSGGGGGWWGGRTLDRLVLGIKAGGTTAAEPRKAGTSERPLIPSELQLNYRKQAGK